MKKAFTLAEVLITLAIVGIVAALTIPTMVQNYEKKMLSVRIKKFVSTFNQAYKMAIANYGDPAYWHDCTVQEGKSSCTTVTGAKSQKILSSMKVTDITDQIPESYKQGIEENFDEIMGGGWPNWEKTQCWQLPDGSFILHMIDWTFKSSNESVTTFIIDVNGISKPNRLGKDIFQFAQVHTSLNEDGGQHSYSAWTTYEPLSQGLYLNGYGYSRSFNICKNLDKTSTLRAKYDCTADMLQTNGWEFPDNYPWDAF